MRIGKGTGTNPQAYRNFTVTENVVGEFTLQAAVSSASNLNVYLRDSAGQIGTYIRINSGGAYAVENGSTTNITPGGSWADTGATSFKVVTNTTARTYDVYVNGSSTASATGVSFYHNDTSTAGLGRFQVSRFTGNDGLVDDVSITPEPATMTLLLLGLPLALRRRRRA